MTRQKEDSSERKEKMFTTNFDQGSRVVDESTTYTTFPLTFVVQPDVELNRLLADLSPDTPWGLRKIAAQKIADEGSPEAVHGLLDALSSDPFWLVRCAIIQAVERIGDPNAIPTLREVAQNDGFQIVRSYAAKAVERLSWSG